MTPGTEPALTPDEWLSGVNRGKTLKVPGVSVGVSAWGCARVVGDHPGLGESPKSSPRSPPLCPPDPILMSLKEGYKRTSKIVFKAPVREKKGVVVNGIDLLENVPPRTENEVGQRRAAPSSPATGMVGFGVSPIFTPILSILPPLQHGAWQSGVTLLKAFPEILPWKKHGEELGAHGWAHPRRAPLFSCLQTSCAGSHRAGRGKFLRGTSDPPRGHGAGSVPPAPAPFSFQLLRMFFRQQDEIRRLKDELSQKDIRIRQLQLELKNLRNSPKNN